MENKNHISNQQLKTNNQQPRYLRLSGLEPLVVTPESNFINVGERTNVAGSKKFLRLINEEKYAELVYRGWVSKKYYGRLHLKQYLMKKNVREDYQQNILHEFTPAEETDRAEAFLRLQLPKLRMKYKTQEEKLRGAVARALASRGFGSDVVWSCIDKIGEE